jgi:hypothetical protein
MIIRQIHPNAGIPGLNRSIRLWLTGKDSKNAGSIVSKEAF